MFTITRDPVDIEALRRELIVPNLGVIVAFEGRVRNNNDGREVTTLEYEAYESLAAKEGCIILEEAKKRFSILEVRGVHRIGRLEVGEAALCVVVAAAHREAAIRACEGIIDEIKRRVPVWKKEHYKKGEAQWIQCRLGAAHACLEVSETAYYSRQQCLPNIGAAGQKKLKDTRVLVVGAGGLGCPALVHLATAGVGHLGVCDGDRLEVSNLHRQTLYSHQDLGEFKADLAKRRLFELNPFVEVNPIPYKVDVDNVEEIVAGYDVVLDCTDSIKAKFLLHDACYLGRIPFVQGGIYQYEGELQLFVPGSEGGCMRCLWPAMPEENCVGHCADVGVLGVVPGVVGSLQAMETLKVLLGWEGTADKQMVLVDLMALSMSKVRRSKVSSCPLCGDSPTIDKVDAKHYTPAAAPWELDLSQCAGNIFDEYQVLDIREASERDLSNPWEQALRHHPGGDDEGAALPTGDKQLLICESGARSHRLAKAYRDQGHDGVFSLTGGMPALKEYWKRFRQ